MYAIFYVVGMERNFSIHAVPLTRWVGAYGVGRTIPLLGH